MNEVEFSEMNGNRTISNILFLPDVFWLFLVCSASTESRSSVMRIVWCERLEVGEKLKTAGIKYFLISETSLYCILFNFYVAFCSLFYCYLLCLADSYLFSPTSWENMLCTRGVAKHWMMITAMWGRHVAPLLWWSHCPKADRRLREGDETERTIWVLTETSTCLVRR